MPAITEKPPKDVQAEVAELRARLAQTIPAKQLDHNPLIATWNLRAFGGLTEKWTAGPDDTPKRDYGDLARIAEIVSHFDVIAMQEVRGDIKALRHLLKTLGDQWAMILTDVTKGKAGNDERMAFLFDTRRVRPSGLACELVLPEEHAGRPAARGLRQFARTPYAVSFLAAGREYRATFILVTLHVIYGKQASDRSDEAQGERGMARRLGARRERLRREPHRAGRLQHRSGRRRELRSVCLHGTTSAGGARRPTPYDFREQRSCELLRPDRVVHR